MSYLGNLRGRLIIAMSLLTLVVLAVTYFGLRGSVTADIEARLDQRLKSDYRDLKREALDPAKTSDQLKAGMKDYLATRAYSRNARVYVFQFTDGTRVTNRGDLKGSVDGRPESEANAALLAAGAGLTTVKVGDEGRFRVYTKPLMRGGKQIAICVLATPLSVVDDTQKGLARSFLFVALLTLALAVAASAFIAGRLTSPLRRISGIATQIDSEQLGKRINYRGSDSELAALASSFDRMLGRLEAAFSKQREFVSDASHELRTPLTVLRGQVELLDREPQMSLAERQRTLDMLLKEIDLMNRLVDDMLTLAKLDSRQSLQLGRVKIDDFTEDFERDLPLLGARNYRVNNNADGHFELDLERISQVLRNLVRNAVAHTGSDGKIEVGFSSDAENLKVYVADNGSGIAADELEKIFDRFHRTDESRTRVQGGSGLGLAIVQAIVAAHGGSVAVESEFGKGTKFTFVVPRSSSKELPAAA